MKQWVKDLMADMPEQLVWDHEPGARAGDLYIFDWRKIHYQEPTTGEPQQTEIPGIYIRLTAHPKRRRTLRDGYRWHAPYVWGGIEDEYLAPGAGTVTDPRRSIDPERPVTPVQVSPEERDRNRMIAAARRHEARQIRKRARMTDYNRRQAA